MTIELNVFNLMKQSPLDMDEDLEGVRVINTIVQVYIDNTYLLTEVDKCPRDNEEGVEESEEKSEMEDLHLEKAKTRLKIKIILDLKPLPKGLKYSFLDQEK